MAELNAAMLQKVLDGQNKLFDGLQQLHHKLDSVVSQFQSEIEGLKKENNRLKKDLQEVTSRLDKQEQQSKSKNVVIYGVPGVAEESREETEAKIAKIAGIVHLNHKVVAAHRLSPASNGPILAAFENKAHAQDMINAVRKSTLTAADVERTDIERKPQGGEIVASKKIFAPPHLCAALVQLRKAAAALKHEANWGWTKVNTSRIEVQIYKGRDDKGNVLPPITVRSLEDVLKLRLQMVEKGILPQIKPGYHPSSYHVNKKTRTGTAADNTTIRKEKG